MDVCGAGVDQGFSYNLGPGEEIRIGQSSNAFDSQHTLRYGGGYPGDSVVECVDDPDTKVLSYANTGEVEVAVYFVIDAYSSSEAGNFELAWDWPGMPRTHTM